MKLPQKGILIIYLMMPFIMVLTAQEHPSLIITKKGVEEIRAALGTVSLFDNSLKEVQAEVDAEMASGIETPIPIDYSGGYTHERHKRNFLMLQKAGLLFQILQNEKYAVYIRDMLFQYEAMYKDLPKHPKERSYARGKLFWQCLNDSNWLVYVSQAYDCIYEWLSEEERMQLEKNLFRPFADFISLENPKFFNRVHNHSTWGNAAVGMIGLVMNDEELINRAVYGLKDVELDYEAKDDDGGYLFTKGKAGFLANLEEPFSPDGYYTEGPYYQRYAMYPFLIFAVGLHNMKPELKIFEYKDSVLLKSVKTLIDLSDKDGEFFPLNDAQKGMSYHSRELVTAVDIAYHYGNKNTQLLSIAKEQNRVVLDDSGLEVARAIHTGRAKPYVKKSVNYSDGADGKHGGIAVLRMDELELVFKYTAQGLSHGHYDKLSFMLYDGGEDVLQDYGMARFVNIEQKGGGNYLPENKSWAKQTIAHNTLIQNEISHFTGKYELGSQHHSELHFFDAENENVQGVSAKETNAYPGTEMHRTMLMFRDDGFERPLVLDVFRISSNAENQYDLPYYFMGQLMQVNFEYDSPDALRALGSDHGYQHLYLEGRGKASGGKAQMSWLRDANFYSLTSATKLSDELLFTRVGANDPQFNLRRDAAFMLRRINAKNTVFVSLIEAHGHYSPVSEIAVNAYSNVSGLEIIHSDEEYTAVKIQHVMGKNKILIISNQDASETKRHQIKIKNEVFEWEGPYHYNQIN